VLVFSKIVGFRHGSIAGGIAMLQAHANFASYDVENGVREISEFE
jgi:hypothetical protein